MKVLAADGLGLQSELICGIDWVTANASRLGIKVANLSLEGSAPHSTCRTDPLHAAICNSTAAGVTYTVAAGNSGSDLGASAPAVPASFPEVLTVTAMSDVDGQPGGRGGSTSCSPPPEADDQVATFSNYATRPIDVNHVLAAPGVCIRSTVPGGLYATESGTSIAAPHVAGIVALCVGHPGSPGPCAEMNPGEVVQQIRADAAANATVENGFLGDPSRPVGGAYFGYLVSGIDPSLRRLPLVRAVQEAQTPPSPPPDTTIDLFLRMRSIQDVDTLHVVARLAEEGTVRARGTVRLSRAIARGTKRVRLLSFRSERRTLVPQRRTRVRLKLDRRALRAVKRTLKRVRRLAARLTVRAEDRAGNSVVKKARVRLLR